MMMMIIISVPLDLTQYLHLQYSVKLVQDRRRVYATS